MSKTKLLLLSLSVFILSACGGGSSDTPTPTPPQTPTPTPTPTPENGGILVFSETAGFRHESISDGQTMLSSIANENGWEIDFTEDSSQFNATNLSQYSVVVWLNTTGDVLTNPRSA
ncbi:ThuA domain-containing protein [uncultured Paraglaciecola sp.]|jgi:hypothetical protein|uniref:ThuA domain-containing protein n=1 Tax=uncultured Paraglaciecola sp. TaxID=1765024 RepID=UPI002617AF68|nr:ThuA domain-containing protein [uncultured Paraglaciecola sp.]